MEENRLLGIIDDFWKARMAGDKAGVASFLAPGATYELAGAGAFADPVAVGPSAEALTASARLIDDFRFHSVERLTSIMEGRKAAVVSRVEVSFRGGAITNSELCDVWEFDEGGKVRALKQFADTHLIHRMMNGAA